MATKWMEQFVGAIMEKLSDIMEKLKPGSSSQKRYKKTLVIYSINAILG
jgi:hypothetical protein